MVESTEGTGTAEARRGVDRVARLTTEVFAPAVLVIAILVVVGVACGGSPLTGLAWGCVAALFCGAIPYGFMILRVRRGQLTDRHIHDRRQRIGPLMFSMASVGIGLAALVFGNAPRAVLALVVTMLTALGVFAAVTSVWKISFHAGVAAGDITVLVILFGPAVFYLAPLVLLVGWSRVRLRDHTTPEVIGGALLGAALTAALFPALR